MKHLRFKKLLYLVLLVSFFNSYCKDNPAQLIIQAAENGDIAQLEKLLDQGVSANTQTSESGKTLLQLVIEQPAHQTPVNQEPLVESLLLYAQNPADPNIVDFAGNSPLIDVVKLCLAHKITPQDTDAIAQILLNAGARTNIVNKQGQDVFYWIDVLNTGMCSDTKFLKSLGSQKIYKDIDLATQLKLILTQGSSQK